MARPPWQRAAEKATPARLVLARAEGLAAGSSCALEHLLAALLSLPEGIEALEAVGLCDDELADMWARLSERAGIDPLASAADAPLPLSASLPSEQRARCAWARPRRRAPRCR